jgi:uncharacterized protein with GYD domain
MSDGAEMHGAAPGEGWRGQRVLVLSPTPTHPLDFGNRKRIYNVCRDLQALGAEIHFVHYPAEADWRRSPPLDALRAMQACWETVYTVPLTRPVHPAPAGADHTIDEWWDPAIGDMLAWLFATQSFDVILVNYTWLSKALEFAPRGVLKVLDTHDRFANRRALLEANGIKPEFFYTTEEDEAKALDRADLIWAIKPEEEAAFREITRRPVLTLPYIEPLRYLGRDSWPDGIVRFGMVGARNNINLMNLRAFIEAARHHVEKTLLPAEFLIAGSCCDDLRADRLPPYIRLVGRVPDMADFYRRVDVVLVPMTFSTGLKIKVGEALGLGKAVISLAHAFEGYEPAHDFHRLPDLASMLWACKEVVARPELTDQLEIASLRSSQSSLRRIADGLAETARQRWAMPKGVCVVLDAAQLRTGSLLLDHACDVGQYIAYQVPVYFLLSGELPGRVDEDAARRLIAIGDVVAMPGLAPALVPALCRAVNRTSLRQRSLPQVVAEGHHAIWFAGPPPAGERLPERARKPAFLSAEAYWHARGEGGLCDFVADLAGRFGTVHLLAQEDSAEVSAACCAANVQRHRVPLFYKGHQALAMWALERAGRDGVLFLAEDPGGPLLRLALDIGRRQGQGRRLEVMSGAPASAEMPDDVSIRVPERFFADIWQGETAPELVFDVGGPKRLRAVREALSRSGVPVIRLFTSGPASRPAFGKPAQAASGVFASLERIGQALADPAGLRAAAAQELASPVYVNDPGWAIVWGLVANYSRLSG